MKIRKYVDDIASTLANHHQIGPSWQALSDDTRESIKQSWVEIYANDHRIMSIKGAHSKSEAKAKASRENGKKGGRPKGKIIVEYKSGMSRYSTKGIDYMLATADGIELYAEVETDSDDETASYEELKSMILDQAEQNGINPDRLRFWYDD